MNRGKRGGFLKKLGDRIKNLRSKSNEEVVDVSLPLTIVSDIEANKNADFHRLHLNVLCFFSFININQPRQVNLTRIVNVAKDLYKHGRSFTLYNFACFAFQLFIKYMG